MRRFLELYLIPRVSIIKQELKRRKKNRNRLQSCSQFQIHNINLTVPIPIPSKTNMKIHITAILLIVTNTVYANDQLHRQHRNTADHPQPRKKRPTPINQLIDDQVKTEKHNNMKASVAKSPNAGSKCSDITEKQTCNKTPGCGLNVFDSKCKTALSTSECSKYDGKRRKCKKNGCKWRKNTKTCIGRWD